MRSSSTFQFSPEQIADMKASLKAYFADELEVEIGDLQAGLLIEFLHQKIGHHYYNLGILDTITAIKEKTEDLVLLLKDKA